jgi:hypothetical protein
VLGTDGLIHDERHRADHHAVHPLVYRQVFRGHWEKKCGQTQILRQCLSFKVMLDLLFDRFRRKIGSLFHSVFRASDLSTRTSGLFSVLHNAGLVLCFAKQASLKRPVS